MNCKQETYRRLGDFITQRREKNNEHDVPIRGVSKEGFIDPKQKDADTSIYNVFYKNDFVFNPARMELNSIALNRDLEKGICSSLYEIFYINDTNELDPIYLNMLLKRDHFIRFCAFKGWGSVREYFRVNEICEYMIPVPPIEEQRKIVDNYLAIQKRIENNKQTIAKLEEAAQAIYRKMFVDELTPKGTVKDLCKSFSGFPFDGESYSTECGTVALRGENVTEKSLRWDTVKRYNGVITERITNYYLKDWDIVIGMDGSKVGKNWSFIHNNNLPLLLAQRVACLRCDSIEKQVFLFLAIQTEHFVEYVSRVNTGSTILHISTSQIDDFPIPIPSEQQFLLIREKIVPIFQYIQFRTQENELLSRIKSLFNDTIV